MFQTAIGYYDDSDRKLILYISGNTAPINIATTLHESSRSMFQDKNRPKLALRPISLRINTHGVIYPVTGVEHPLRPARSYSQSGAR